MRVGRARCAAAILGIASILTVLVLPFAHALAVETADATTAPQGVALAGSDSDAHSPLDCPLCEKLGHARHGLAMPVVLGALALPNVARAAAIPPDLAPSAPRRSAAPARAPPALPLFS